VGAAARVKRTGRKEPQSFEKKQRKHRCRAALCTERSTGASVLLRCPISNQIKQNKKEQKNGPLRDPLGVCRSGPDEMPVETG
jgi:hypothetical protein